jgi:hypothetical protein
MQAEWVSYEAEYTVGSGATGWPVWRWMARPECLGLAYFDSKIRRYSHISKGGR